MIKTKCCGERIRKAGLENYCSSCNQYEPRTVKEIQLVNKYGNLKSKKIAEEVADSLGLSVVKSQLGGYFLE